MFQRLSLMYKRSSTMDMRRLISSHYVRIMLLCKQGLTLLCSNTMPKDLKSKKNHHLNKTFIMLRESEIAVSNFLSYKRFFKSLEAWSTHEFENLLEFLSISFVLMKKICLPHKIIFFCVVHRPATHPDLIGISRFFSTNLGVS